MTGQSVHLDEPEWDRAAIWIATNETAHGQNHRARCEEWDKAVRSIVNNEHGSFVVWEVCGGNDAPAGTVHTAMVSYWCKNAGWDRMIPSLVSPLLSRLSKGRGCILLMSTQQKKLQPQVWNESRGPTNLTVQQNHWIKTKHRTPWALFRMEIGISRGQVWDSDVWRRSPVGSEASGPPLAALWSGVWKPSLYLHYVSLPLWVWVANVADSLWKDPEFRLFQPIPSLSRTARGFCNIFQWKAEGGIFFFLSQGSRLCTGYSLVVLGYSSLKVTFPPRYLQWQR